MEKLYAKRIAAQVTAAAGVGEAGLNTCQHGVGAEDADRILKQLSVVKKD